MSQKKTSCFFDIEVYPNMLMATFMRPNGEHDMFLQWVGVDNDIGKFIDQGDKLYEYLSQPRIYIGYNNSGYDSPVLSTWMESVEANDSIEEQIEACVDLSKSIIVDKVRPYNVERRWKDVDLMSVIQKGGERKSLKEVAINLNWHLIMDLIHDPTLPVPFDMLQDMYKYNLNDVEITKELYKRIQGDIKLRRSLSIKYGVDVTSSSNSEMGKKILDVMYAEAVGHWGFKKGRSPRNWMSMGDIIPKAFTFKTPDLNDFLRKLRADRLHIDHDWKRIVKIGNTTYKMAKGGLHSADHTPEIIEADDVMEIRDIDARSFYPNAMITMNIRPEHLDGRFLKLVERIVDERLTNKDKVKDLTSDDVLYAAAKLGAEALKIAINAIFGRLGHDKYWLYDPLCLYRVTINGQLLLFRLIEAFENKGIRVFYGNTDGVTIHSRRDQGDIVDRICREWEVEFGIDLETEHYSKFILRDVNNYIAVKTNGTTKARGEIMNKDSLIHPTVLQGLMTAYKAPVISLAIHNYFVNGTPIENTIKATREPLMFCIGSKVGRTFHSVTYSTVETDSHGLPTKKITEIQRTNRYFVTSGQHGGNLHKWKRSGKGDQPHQLIAGERVFLYNDITNQPNVRGFVNESWYYRQALRQVQHFTTTQTELF